MEVLLFDPCCHVEVFEEVDLLDEAGSVVLYAVEFSFSHDLGGCGLHVVVGGLLGRNGGILDLFVASYVGVESHEEGESGFTVSVDDWLPVGPFNCEVALPEKLFNSLPVVTSFLHGEAVIVGVDIELAVVNSGQDFGDKEAIGKIAKKG